MSHTFWFLQNKLYHDKFHVIKQRTRICVIAIFKSLQISTGVPLDVLKKLFCNRSLVNTILYQRFHLAYFKLKSNQIFAQKVFYSFKSY